jgi:Flp pilus assembly protein TadD
MASMNPFAKKDAFAAQMPVPGAPATGVKAKLASVGTGTKTLWNKSTAVFRKDGEEINAPDPLSLSEMPEKVDPKIHVANGQLWESTGEPKKAAESYGRALTADPNNGPALANLARLQYREGNYAAAAEQFQKALNQSPNDAQLCNELGLTLHKLGRTDMALTLMQRALTIEPGNSRFANNLASVMHESGNPDGAFQVLAKNNKPAVAHFNMAYLQFKSGNNADAKKHLAETLQAEGTSNNDPSVTRAIDRSKEMMAQIAAMDGQGTANNSVGSIASAAPTAGKPQPPKSVATSNKTATTSKSSGITTPPSIPAIGVPPAGAKVASHTSPDAKSAGGFGFGWPAQDAASGTSVQTASAKIPVSNVPATNVPTTNLPGTTVPANNAALTKPQSFTMPPTKPTATPVKIPAEKVGVAKTTAATVGGSKPDASGDPASTPSWLKAFDASKTTTDAQPKPRRLTRPTN